MVRIGVLLGALALTACAAPPPKEKRSRAAAEPIGFLPAERRVTSMRINVDVEGVDLSDVMHHIGRQVGRKIDVAPAVAGVSVTTSMRDVGWRKAVEHIAELAKCQVKEQGEGLLITRQ